MPHRFAFAAAALLVVPGAAVVGVRAWQPPLPGPLTVVRPFARPDGPYGAGHRGVDLAAPPGAVVLAAGAGTVAFAGPVAGRDVVVVAHGAEVSTEYEPVAAVVRVGAAVATGEPIGVLQAPVGHCGPRSCLHWGLRRAGRYEDPMSLLRRAPVLLPFLDAGPGGVTTDRTPGASGAARSASTHSVRPVVVAGGAAAGGGLVAAAAPAVGRLLRRARPAAR